MPNPTIGRQPVRYRDYYRRFWSHFKRDLFRLGAAQVIGALLTLGITALQFYFGLIPASQTRLAWESILLPYVVLIVVLCFISALRAPVAVDRGRDEEIAQQAEEIGKLLKDTSGLREQLRPKTELSQKAIEVLVACAEASADFANIIISSDRDYLTAGHTFFQCHDLVEMKEYLEAVESELKGDWVRNPDPSNRSYYEPTSKGLKKGKEILVTAEGKKILETLRRKFRAN
jgi:hypothetical protein